MPLQLAHDYNCYSPLSFQTRQLGAECVRPHHVSRRFPIFLHLLPILGTGPGQPHLNTALARLDSYGFVGLTDTYPLSWCLLMHRLRVEPPAWCFEGPTAGRVNLTHEVHGVPRVRHSDISETTWAQVDALTADDQTLYIAAAQRFVEEVSAFQKTLPLGRKLAPQLFPRLKLLSSLAYMPELRHALATLGAR